MRVKRAGIHTWVQRSCCEQRDEQEMWDTGSSPFDLGGVSRMCCWKGI